MHDPLQRLYRTKLALLATILTVAGLGLLIFANWIEHVSGWQWLSCTYRTLSAVEGHLLRLRVDQPTRGLTVELDYTDTDIAEINVLDFIASSDRAQISRTPVGVPGKKVSVEFDGWAFRRSGVAFVWAD